MFNTQSPIVNNMMGGMYQSGYIPPNPIGNTIGIGTTGYNNMGGYYNNNYGYMNPYLLQQQEQLRQAQEKEIIRKEADTLKSISKRINKALNNDIDEEYLNEIYDPKFEIQEQDMKMQNVYKLMNLHYNGTYGNPMLMRRIQYNNMMYDKAKERCPDNMTMYEFQEKSSELYLEVLEERQKEKMKDVSKLYNQQQFNQLIGMHSKNNNYFGKTFGSQPQGEMNIDDMEIKLPQHLDNQYQERKQAFMNAIMNKGR